MDKELFLSYLNQYVALATLAAFIILIFFFILFYLKPKLKLFSHLYKFSLLASFLITLVGLFLSLFYSEYLNIRPCGLCWFQRIFLYSQTVIFTVAYLKNDLKVFVYTFWLSMVGLIVSLYQEYLQLGYSEIIPCPAISNFADCAKPTFLEYGFITMPFSAAVLFGFLILFSLIVEKFRNNL